MMIAALAAPRYNRAVIALAGGVRQHALVACRSPKTTLNSDFRTFPY
jgi:hypothetical protein